MNAILKKTIKSVLYPHIAVLVSITILSVISLILAFAVIPDNDIFNYCSYVLSAYTLTVICLRIPQIIKKSKDIKQNNKYVNKYSTDRHFRIKLSLMITLALNSIYTIFQLGLGIANNSAWYYSLSGYYFLLALMRLALLNHTLKYKAGEKMFKEQLIYRLCGILLMLMTAALTVITIYVAVNSQASEKNYIIPISMAAFTFTSLTLAILNVIKYRKYNSPVWSASKALSFVSALVSMLTLEDSMLASFGEGNGDDFRQTVVGSTGAGIFAVVIAIAIFMIVHSTKNIKEYKSQNGDTHE